MQAASLTRDLERQCLPVSTHAAAAESRGTDRQGTNAACCTWAVAKGGAAETAHHDLVLPCAVSTLQRASTAAISKKHQAQVLSM